MLRPLKDLRRLIEVLERDLARGAGVELEQGLDLLNVCGRERDQLRAELAALRRELAALVLLEQYRRTS